MLWSGSADIQNEVFNKFAKRQRIADSSLREAVERAGRGLVDADLGGGVIKQRVARPGGRRRGGCTTLIAMRHRAFAVFLFGFAKNERDNIDDEELDDLRSVASQWPGDPARLDIDRKAGTLIEVEDDDEN